MSCAMCTYKCTQFILQCVSSRRCSHSQVSSKGGIRMRKLEDRHRGTVMNGLQGCQRGTNVSLQSIRHILPTSEGYSLAEVNFLYALSCCLHTHIHSVVRGLYTTSPGFVQLKQANLLPHNSAHNLHGNSEYHLHTSRLKHKHSKEASVTSIKPDKHPNQATTSHFLTLFSHPSTHSPFLTNFQNSAVIWARSETTSTTFNKQKFGLKEGGGK